MPLKSIVSKIKIKNGIEFSHSSYFDCFINRYTVNEADVLICNGLRIRTEKELQKLQVFALKRLRFQHEKFDNLLGLTKGGYNYVGITDANYFNVCKALKYIAFYSHILQRCRIYVNREQHLWYFKQSKR